MLDCVRGVIRVLSVVRLELVSGHELGGHEILHLAYRGEELGDPRRLISGNFWNIAAKTRELGYPQRSSAQDVDKGKHEEGNRLEQNEIDDDS